MEQRPDVLVLGGGVIGLSCAYFLLRAGRSVRVLERGSVGAATSHGNCGTITPSHAPPLAAPGVLSKAARWMLQPDAPLYVRPRLDPALAGWLLRFAGRCNRRDWWASARAKGELLTQSRRLIESIIRDEAMDCGFEASGLSYVYRDPRAFDADRLGLPDLASLGIEAEVLDGAALAAREPALLPGLAGAIHFPGDAQLRPDRYTSELARCVRALGGVIEESVGVTGLWHEGGSIVGVDTSHGVRRAGDIVVAMGPWSAPFLQPLGLKLPIQPGKGYSMTYSRPVLAPRAPMVLREHSVCVTAWADGFRLGSTMEFSGYDDTLNRRRLDAITRAARGYLREPVGLVLQEEWFGWRPMTVDDLPLLGAVPGRPGLWLATGHGMMGMGMSAISGLLVADLLCGRTPSIDPVSVRPSRVL
ncbi:FAD-dependent oxidoreductase [soil metagenome]